MTNIKSAIVRFVNLRKNYPLIVLVGLLFLVVVYFLISSREVGRFDIDKVEIEGVSPNKEQNARMKVKNLELQLLNFDREHDSYDRLDRLFLCASANIVVNGKIKGHSFSVLKDKNFSTIFPVKVSFTTGADGGICMRYVSVKAN